MTGRQLIIAAVLLSSMLGASKGGAGQQSGKPSTLPITECEIRGVDGKARCGDYEVFENRATRKGRKIGLKVVLLPATGQPEDRTQETGDRRQKASRTWRTGTGDEWRARAGDWGLATNRH